MSYIKQFSVDPTKHPKTIEILESWKEQRVNISDKICQLIDAEVMKEQNQQQSTKAGER